MMLESRFLELSEASEAWVDVERLLGCASSMAYE